MTSTTTRGNQGTTSTQGTVAANIETSRTSMPITTDITTALDNVTGAVVSYEGLYGSTKSKKHKNTSYDLYLSSLTLLKRFSDSRIIAAIKERFVFHTLYIFYCNCSIL